MYADDRFLDEVSEGSDVRDQAFFTVVGGHEGFVLQAGLIVAISLLDVPLEHFLRGTKHLSAVLFVQTSLFCDRVAHLGVLLEGSLGQSSRARVR